MDVFIWIYMWRLMLYKIAYKYYRCQGGRLDFKPQDFLGGLINICTQ